MAKRKSSADGDERVKNHHEGRHERRGNETGGREKKKVEKEGKREKRNKRLKIQKPDIG